MSSSSRVRSSSGSLTERCVGELFPRFFPLSVSSDQNAAGREGFRDVVKAGGLIGNSPRGRRLSVRLSYDAIKSVLAPG